MEIFKIKFEREVSDTGVYKNILYSEEERGYWTIFSSEPIDCIQEQLTEENIGKYMK